MPRLYLMDPWLADAKGHNYQYALDVAQAARQQGYDPVVAIRSAVSPGLRFPEDWQVERVFKYGDCPQHWISLGERRRHPSDVEGNWLPDSRIHWWEKLIDVPNRIDRRRRIAGFVRDCSRLFAKVPPQDGDILFLPSLTEFDFLSAARFWREHAWTRRFDWHLQFHFNFFVGRDPEFAVQSQVLWEFQQLFRAAVDQIPEHRLHFYATSEAIARQYDALGIAIFHPLPYPVRRLQEDSSGTVNSFNPQPVGEDETRTCPTTKINSASSSPTGCGLSEDKQETFPLRVTLPGAMRREKGKKQLTALIDSVWDEFLKSCRLQFVFQASPKQIEQWLPGRVRSGLRIPPAGSVDVNSPVLATAHPLDAEKYTELICQSDIGLFIYDAQRYFARVSGVMCEMLSAGVPVIVPAGCWLADQIADENFSYVEKLWRRYHRQCKSISVSQKSAEVIQLPANTHSLLVRFDWRKQTAPGTYAEVSVDILDGAGSPPASQRWIVGWREGGPAGAVFEFGGPVSRVQVSLGNAFSTAELGIETFEIMPLPTPSIPLGSVGLIAADEREVPRLLREMTTHYEHYQSTAHQFALQWQAMHCPQQTVSRLAARTQLIAPGRQVHAA